MREVLSKKNNAMLLAVITISLICGTVGTNYSGV